MEEAIKWIYSKGEVVEEDILSASGEVVGKKYKVDALTFWYDLWWRVSVNGYSEEGGGESPQEAAEWLANDLEVAAEEMGKVAGWISFRFLG